MFSGAQGFSRSRLMIAAIVILYQNHLLMRLESLEFPEGLDFKHASVSEKTKKI